MPLIARSRSNPSDATRASVRLTLLGAALLAAGCGDGSSTTARPQPAPAGEPPATPAPAEPPPGGGSSETLPVVYVADQEAPGRYELYVAQSSGVHKLNAALPTGGAVEKFAVTPDRSAVIYTADQQIDGRRELYIVSLANPGSPTRLNPALTVNRDVLDFVLSPDGHRVIYRADQDIDQVHELYSVGIATPGVATRLNATLPSEGWVRSGFSFSPDGTRVLYRADQSVTGRIDLYVLDLTSAGGPVQVNPALVSGGNISELFGFSPDGSTIGYIADQDVNDKLELYGVAANALGTAVKLNGQMIAEGDVCRFTFSPDSARVAYCADQEIDEVMELYTVAVATPSQSSKVNPTLTPGGYVSTGYEFAPDSSFMVYAAAQDSAGSVELYRVDLAAPGVATKLNLPLSTGRHVTDFQIRPDGTRVGYVANQDSAVAYELFELDLQSAAAPVKLSGPMLADGLYNFEYTAQGSQVVYLANQDSNLAELYRVEAGTPGVSTRINAPLVAGGEVWEYELVE